CNPPLSDFRCAPLFQNNIGNISPAHRHQLLSRFCLRRLGPTEVTTSTAKAAVIFGLVAKSLRVIVKVRIESANDFCSDKLRKAMQRHGCFRLARMPFHLGSWALIKLFNAGAITGSGDLRIADEADTENLGG